MKKNKLLSLSLLEVFYWKRDGVYFGGKGPDPWSILRNVL